MLQQEIATVLNQQMNREFESAWLYLSMAGWCHYENFLGFAHWLELQAKEEEEHGMKFFHYLNEQEATIQLETLPQPIQKWPSLIAVFETAYKSEKATTKHINALMAAAAEQKDYASRIFLNWFVTEQVEEENQTNELYEKLKRFEENTAAIYLLDLEAGKRRNE